MLYTTLMLVLVFCAICIVVLVLLQRGKGADAGAGFGAGASGTIFGARGATTALSRATAVLAGIFMITCLLLSYVVTRSATTQQSELDRIAEEARRSSVPVAPASLPAPPPVPVPAAPAADPAATEPTAPAGGTTPPAN
ncbi:MAG: preprotein translocase subunit SecG [Nevskiaceae bacterium]|jgi:preprotein translocase subunit SecG|nr:preprotein translocase subunit SecG [Nevskiaceae bacterium]